LILPALIGVCLTAILFDTHGTAYSDCGTGPAVLLIHGVGLSHRIWSPVVPLISGGRRVITLDMLGHGSSPLPREGATIDDYATQAFYLLDHLDIGSCAVVGFSMGALVAQQMALDQPARVREIAAVSGVHARNPEQRAAIRKRAREFAEKGLEPFIPGALERWLTPAFRQAHPEVEAEIAADLCANDLTGYLRSYEIFAYSDDTIAPRACAIRCRTLVVTGEHDSGSTAEMAHALGARIAGSKVVILPGLRHLLTTEAPELLAKHLDEFLHRDWPTSSNGRRIDSRPLPITCAGRSA
jgi:pimeloyl-ACP methyl ester carboxylesterase